MKIYLGLKGSIIVEHKKKELFFGKFGRSPESALTELNSFWASLPTTVQDDLFDCYTQVYDLITSGESVNLNTYKYLLDDVHTEEGVTPHCKNIAYPKFAVEEFESSNKHYTKAETYTLSEYRALAILSVRLRSLIPIFGAMGLFASHKSESGGRIMHVVKEITDNIEACDISTCDAYDRMWVYINATQQKLVENSKEVSLTGTVIEALGTIDLPVYLVGVSIVSACVTTPINTPATNVAKSINNKLKDELNKKITKRFNISDERPFAKMVSAEDNNIGYFDTYMSREQVPESIALMCGVWVENYRRARKRWEGDLSPSEIKEYIVSIENNPYPQLTIVHQCLLKLCSMGLILHQTISDIPAEMLNSLIGISQAFLMENKLPRLARLLSAHATLIERGGSDFCLGALHFSAMSKDIEDWVSKNYSLRIPAPDTNTWVYGYELTINAITKEFGDFVWEQRATPAVCKLLGTENGIFSPDVDIKDDLGKLIAIANINAKKYKEEESKSC